MKRIYVFLLGVFFSLGASAQQKQKSDSSSGQSQLLSAGVNLPFGEFSETHSFGWGISYEWSNLRFGKMKSKPADPVGFTFNGGAGHHFGKKDSFNYRYKSYFYFHGYAGLIVNPSANINISLTAGPTLGLYAGDAEIGFGVNLQGSHFVEKYIAISPGLSYMKHANTAALWVGSIRMSYAF